MEKIVIKPYDVVSRADLPEISVNKVPTDGDPIEINGELFFVCEQNDQQQADPQVIGVIPLVVRNPGNVRNIKKYIECLSIAHRKVKFKNDKGFCDLENCDEMIIS
jgi:hypothetical protein